MSEGGAEAAERWRLDGRLALVTGATLGIGLAVAEEFLRLGATVLAVARDAKRLDERLESWRRRGARAHGLAADVSLEEGRGAVLRRLEELGAGLDVLVNTELGDTYTLAEYTQWLNEAGFPRVETADIGSHSPAIIGHRD